MSYSTKKQSASNPSATKSPPPSLAGTSVYTASTGSSKHPAVEQQYDIATAGKSTPSKLTATNLQVYSALTRGSQYSSTGYYVSDRSTDRNDNIKKISGQQIDWQPK